MKQKQTVEIPIDKAAAIVLLSAIESPTSLFPTFSYGMKTLESIGRMANAGLFEEVRPFGVRLASSLSNEQLSGTVDLDAMEANELKIGSFVLKIN